jgi:hypothetical protein
MQYEEMKAAFRPLLEGGPGVAVTNHGSRECAPDDGRRESILPPRLGFGLLRRFAPGTDT